jgi:tRNA threonylcarbamoyladenosine biosynthesis protein TsaE
MLFGCWNCQLYFSMPFYFYMNKFITTNKIQTQKLGEILAKEIGDEKVICLSGDLGSGKTTFTQGFLKGLKIKGPYTSPTFLIMKHYKKELPISKSQFPNKFKIQNSKFKIINIYHIDAYRINIKDLLGLGWEEMITDKNNISIIEWAERVKKIIPKNAIWIKFKWLDENRRELNFLRLLPKLGYRAKNQYSLKSTI